MQNELWFKNKTYGWGWTPANWKGWLTILIYGIVLLIYPFLAKSGNLEFSLMIFWSVNVIASAILIFICFKKGEKPEWRWGKN